MRDRQCEVTELLDDVRSEGSVVRRVLEPRGLEQKLHRVGFVEVRKENRAVRRRVERHFMISASDDDLPLRRTRNVLTKVERRIVRVVEDEEPFFFVTDEPISRVFNRAANVVGFRDRAKGCLDSLF